MRTFSLVNMKGGVGKSTLAVNIADVLARRHGKRVLLIDTDPQFNATQMLISGEAYVQRLDAGANTILDIFDDQPKIRMSAIAGPQVVPAVALAQVLPWDIEVPGAIAGGSLKLIAGDLELYRLEMNHGTGREQRLRRFIEVCEDRGDIDIVVIDTPPTPSTWMTAALFASDGYLIPVRPEPISRTGVDLLKGVVDRISGNFGRQISCLGVVLTITDEHYNVFGQAVQFFDNNAVWAGKRFTRHLPRRTAVAEDQGEQIRILDSDQPEAKTAVVGITAELLQRIEA
ncbi:ParA family protein [Ramlibacter sp.]|uniref:ParA family protein n=1 Tax=Ramlibacter sp. TaxID=1917967 RepID=UPI0017D98359|nr:ParA family protein [Ramlibacter sp.]MBA2673009.1 ParA family protein [Ramlibacter sp.]